jgi:hypothetical protein
MDADNSQPYFIFFIPWIFLQSRHQQTRALNKVEFVTGSNPLHVWAPWCHLQAFFQIKEMQSQNVNLGVHSPRWNDSIVKILKYNCWFTAVITSECQLVLSWPTWIQSTPSYATCYRLVSMLSSHLCLDLSSGSFLQVCLPKPCIH